MIDLSKIPENDLFNSTAYTKNYLKLKYVGRNLGDTYKFCCKEDDGTNFTVDFNKYGKSLCVVCDDIDRIEGVSVESATQYMLVSVYGGSNAILKAPFNNIETAYDEAKKFLQGLIGMKPTDLEERKVQVFEVKHLAVFEIKRVDEPKYIIRRK